MVELPFSLISQKKGILVDLLGEKMREDCLNYVSKISIIFYVNWSKSLVQQLIFFLQLNNILPNWFCVFPLLKGSEWLSMTRAQGKQQVVIVNNISFGDRKLKFNFQLHCQLGDIGKILNHTVPPFYHEAGIRIEIIHVHCLADSCYNIYISAYNIYTINFKYH